MRRLCSGGRVLNVFSYTGGFSVMAGVGGASHVTSIDSAEPAIAAANANWTVTQSAATACNYTAIFLKNT